MTNDFQKYYNYAGYLERRTDRFLIAMVRIEYVINGAVGNNAPTWKLLKQSYYYTKELI